MKKATGATSGVATSVDAYLAGVPEPARTTLERLRKDIRAAAPKAVECISYQMPTYKQDGMLVSFGAWRGHCALYGLSSTLAAAHGVDLKGYDTSKGTIRFAVDKPLPAALVKKLVKTRLAENAATVAQRRPSRRRRRRARARRDARRQEWVMRKLIESTFVTLDGVIDSPQRWGGPYWDDEHAGYAHDLLFASDALLLGRVTYEGFAQAWPSRSGDEFTDRINSMPKYVASTTLTETTWNATLLGPDVAGEVAKLKQQDGMNILKFGTGELDRTLMDHGLVDEFHFWMFPAFAGEGQRLFEGRDLTHLKLLRSTPFKSGIVVMVCAPKG